MERDPLDQRFVDLMREAAEEESVEARARRWRHATPEEHGRALIEVIELAHHIEKSRGRPVAHPPIAIVVKDRVLPWRDDDG